MKPAEFIQKYVQNLCISSYGSISYHVHIYARCSNARNVLFRGAVRPVRRALPFGPARLTVQATLWSDMDLSLPFYQNITHLDVGIAGFDSPTAQTHLRLLPSLTHFAISFHGAFLDKINHSIEQALEQPNLVLCLAEIHYTVRTDRKLYLQTALARREDPRYVVLQGSVSCEREWRKRTRGEWDKWDEAEAVVRSRQSSRKTN